MSIEEKSELEKVELESVQSTGEVDPEIENKPEGKLKTFVKNNKAATFLGILLLVVFVWLSVKIRINERNFNNERTQLISEYESKIDSIQVNHIQFATEVFSWSVRSELLRENAENLNQLLTVFVKGSGADLIQLVNPADNIVLLSTDKKFEGSPYAMGLNLDSNTTNVVKTDNTLSIITPVMGFNNKIGVLIVELKRD
jgi:hypothetical protein